MQRIPTFLRRYWPIGVFLVIYLFIFRNVFLHQLIPFPGELLVSWFFPYSSGGWEGYTPWVTHKEFILADVVRQVYPWRMLSMDLVKEGIIPLWNIYSFSGNPLLANVQSAVLYPLNILFLLIKPQLAWLIYIMIQPILATFFMYLFIRSLALSRLASIFAGIGFAFIGYVMVWFEMGIVGHAALWLPLILWGITKFIDTKKLLFLVVSALGIACSLLAGHTQTTAYILFFAVAYFLAMGWGKLSKRQGMIGLLVISFGITLAAIQLVPSLELMNYSARDVASSAESFRKFIIPWSHIALLFAPDFFGNPATGNFWGKDYGEFMSYSGVVLLLVAFIGLYTQWKKRIIRLLLGTSILSLLIAFFSPAAELLMQMQIPILSTGLPSRTLFLLMICLVIASAYGVESIMHKKQKKVFIPILIVLSIYILLWAIAFMAPLDAANAAITKRNLLLPTGIIFLISVAIMIGRRFPKYIVLLWIVMFSCMGFEYSYFMNKYLPFAPTTYMFPEHPFISKVSNMAGVNRVYGYDTATMTQNLTLQWRLFSPEGYDPLYLKRYSELMRAGATGKLETDFSRTDALFSPSLPASDVYPKQVLLNLLGVAYVLDKDDNPTKKWDPRPERFPQERFALVYQQDKWKIYHNKMALPRAAVFYDYTVISEKEKAIATLFDRTFAYNKKMILETPPSFPSQNLPITPAKIAVYKANTVTIRTDTKESGILFLSDNYYPGWQAFVDDNPVTIIRADYTFRAVAVPSGKHEVRFEYRPTSFYLGAVISFISLVILLVLYKKRI